jgi:hypothetical protein
VNHPETGMTGSHADVLCLRVLTNQMFYSLHPDQKTPGENSVQHVEDVTEDCEIEFS